MTTELIVLIGGFIGVLFCVIGLIRVERNMVKKIKLHNEKMKKKE